MSKLYGKDAVKVGDILYGYYDGRRRDEPVFKEVEVAKVGRKYIYVEGHIRELGIAFDMHHYPQVYDLIAEGGDYRFYRSQEAAERGAKAKLLLQEIHRRSFYNLSDDKVFEIAKILGIDTDK